MHDQAVADVFTAINIDVVGNAVTYAIDHRSITCQIPCVDVTALLNQEVGQLLVSEFSSDVEGALEVVVVAARCE